MVVSKLIKGLAIAKRLFMRECSNLNNWALAIPIVRAH